MFDPEGFRSEATALFFGSPESSPQSGSCSEVAENGFETDATPRPRMVSLLLPRRQPGIVWKVAKKSQVNAIQCVTKICTYNMQICTYQYQIIFRCNFSKFCVEIQTVAHHAGSSGWAQSHLADLLRSLYPDRLNSIDAYHCL